uniref:Uncharacterized protein n=1 Tax=Arundo donax TaxID=35708 RepID=A0A0A9HJ12_ARUDO
MYEYSSPHGGSTTFRYGVVIIVLFCNVIFGDTFLVIEISEACLVV